MFSAFLKALWEGGFKWFSAAIFGGWGAAVALYQKWLALHPEARMPGIDGPWPAFEPWYVYAFFGTLIVVVCRLAYMQANHSVTAPRLYFSNPRVATQKFDIADHPGIEYACIDLHNDPINRVPGSALRAAHVTLEFFEFDGNWRGKFQFARWADNPQPDGTTSYDEFRFRNVEANDGPNRIDIAQRHVGRMDCYAFTTEGQWQPRYNVRHALALRGEKFYVHVIVKSSNAAPFVGCFILKITPEKMTIERGKDLTVKAALKREVDEKAAHA